MYCELCIQYCTWMTRPSRGNTSTLFISISALKINLQIDMFYIVWIVCMNDPLSNVYHGGPGRRHYRKMSFKNQHLRVEPCFLVWWQVANLHWIFFLYLSKKAISTPSCYSSKRTFLCVFLCLKTDLGVTLSLHPVRFEL